MYPASQLICDFRFTTPIVVLPVDSTKQIGSIRPVVSYPARIDHMVRSYKVSSNWPAFRTRCRKRLISRRLIHTLVAYSLCALTLTGCCHVPGARCRDWWRNGFKVGPNYCPPAAPVASEWIDYADPRVKSEEEDLSQWWTVFNDEKLNALIQTAYQQNLTLRKAGRGFWSAAQLGIARGNLFPQEQFAFGDYSRIKASQNVANPLLSAWFSDWEFGLGGSWELDFWGRYRRSIEAADAELDASVENYDDVLVILLSDVAANYVQYRTFQQRLTYARTNVDIQRRSFQLATDKFEDGLVTERDTHQARQNLEQTEALIPALEIGQRQAANRLCVLLGMPPRDLDAILGPGSGVPITPPDVVVGVPAHLIAGGQTFAGLSGKSPPNRHVSASQ